MVRIDNWKLWIENWLLGRPRQPALIWGKDAAETSNLVGTCHATPPWSAMTQGGMPEVQITQKANGLEQRKRTLPR
jgi:hypothetical protein